MGAVKNAKWTVCVALFLAGFFCWIYLVRVHLSGGDWYSDDAYYRFLRPRSLLNILKYFFIPTDATGYYRPVQSILFELAANLPAQTFASYQWITILFIGSGSLAVIAVSHALTKNLVSSAFAGLIYLYSPAHMKPLAWITLWYLASTVSFAFWAVYFRMRFHEKPSWRWRWLFLMSWFFAVGSNNGIHSFEITFMSLDLCMGRGPLRKRFFYMWDHVLVSGCIFFWIYVLNDPFGRSGINANSFFELTEVFRAFFDYVCGSVIHFFGDARAWRGQVAPFYVTLAGFILFLSSLAVVFLDRKYAFIAPMFMGSGLVISLLHRRWQIEYAAPLAACCGVLLAVGISRARIFLKNRFAAVAVIAMLVSLLCLMWIEEVRPIRGYYLRDEKRVAAMMERLHALDAIYPVGVSFRIRVNDPILTGAPVLHYLVHAIDFRFERRIMLFNPEDFRTGEGFGLLTSQNRNIQEALFRSPQKYVDIICDADNCLSSVN